MFKNEKAKISCCISILLLSSLFFLFPSLSMADTQDTPFTVATWNVAFIDRSVSDLDLKGFLREVDFDVLLVDEIKTQKDLDDLKMAMGRNNFSTAISSFSNGDNNLEVGIISRFPLSEVIEFDPSPGNPVDGVTERSLERLDLPGIADVGVDRGFLVAKVPDLKTFFIVSHFKSSRGRSGPSDFENAQKREFVAAALANYVLELQRDNPDYSVVFGGDVNVGVSDEIKNGQILIDDINDGYDDTHAILGMGLVEGLKMRSLAKNVPSTFVGDNGIPQYPEAGAIDVLYVEGPLEDEFKEAQATSQSFGSDHLAVFATLGDQISNPEDGNEISGSVEITNVLPNPIGEDPEQERIVLTFTGDEILDISGWKLQDRSNNVYVFPAGTILVPGDNDLILSRNTMPLNNDGDSIVLFDNTGVQQGPTFSYSGSQVNSGQFVR